MNNGPTIKAGIALAPLLGIAVSLANVEVWLRIISLAVGLAIGVTGLIGVIKSYFKKK